MAERAAAAISLLEHSSRRARGPLLVSARPALSERLRAQAILIAVPRHRNIILNIEGMCDDLAHVQTGEVAQVPEDLALVERLKVGQDQRIQ